MSSSREMQQHPAAAAQLSKTDDPLDDEGNNSQEINASRPPISMDGVARKECDGPTDGRTDGIIFFLMKYFPKRKRRKESDEELMGLGGMSNMLQTSFLSRLSLSPSRY